MESLYRKYRPQTFADVVGQQHVVGTLERAVQEGRTSHAYLFCGPRGTGKTTMARLLAKSLMCERGSGHLPDGTCEQCVRIAEGNHPDVYELDAASRTGVDNVREEIINRVSYAPVSGRYKIYIIDEVHMLTTAAFNALLKTLEEPPEHVVFVLCTTDPQKIPATILSRVQRFDFRAIGDDDIHARLEYVCAQEGFSYDEEALTLVVRHARGGMRDALSTLEQLSVFGGGRISVEAAQDLLGAVPGAELSHVVEALAARDVAMLFLQVGELVESGRDPLQFTRDLAARMRDVYVVRVVGARPEVLGAGADVAQLQAEARAFGSTDRIARVLTILGDAARQMTTAPNQRLVLEIAFTRMARPHEDLTLESLAERLADVERRLQEGATSATSTSVPAQPTPPAQPAEKPADKSGHTPEQRGHTLEQRGHTLEQRGQSPLSANDPGEQRGQSPLSANDPGELQRRWRQTVGELLTRLPSRGSLLTNSSLISDDGSQLVVGLPKGSRFALKMLERPDIRAAVEEVVGEQLGPRTLVYREGMGDVPASSPSPLVPPVPSTAMPAGMQVAPAQATPAQAAGYPIPWEEESHIQGQPVAPVDEQVPYEEVGLPDYGDAEGQFGPMAQFGSQPAPRTPVQREYVPRGQARPVTNAESQTVTKSQVPAQSAPDARAQSVPWSQSPAQTAHASSQPAPQSSATVAVSASRATPQPPDDLPPDLLAILANAFEVFGNDVRVSSS